MSADDWGTKSEDLYVTRQVIAEFGGDETLLGIFEVVTDEHGQFQTARLAEWVCVLIKHFRNLYGESEGDQIMKRVVSNCLIDGQTIH